MKRSGPIKRSTKPIRKRKPRGEETIGKTGRVRLRGEKLESLRRECWERDEGICQRCGVVTDWLPRFDGDPLAFDMAHKVSRGAGGSDTINNVETLCHRDHMREHAEGKE